jgi:hypothetical protein
MAELTNNAGLATNVQENLIYQQVSRNYHAMVPNNSDVSAPAKIVRYLKNQGFRASLVESPTRTVTILAVQFQNMIREWLSYSGELWSWANWIWRWPRGLRERDFDNDARVLMVCAVPGGLHYLLARRDAGNYWVMDPAFQTDQIVPNFGNWAGFYWFNAQSWNPGAPLHTGGIPGRDNYYLGISVWVNTANAPYVFY